MTQQEADCGHAPDLEEHFTRGQRVGDDLTARAVIPEEVTHLAYQSLSAAETVSGPTQVALFAGIVDACIRWLTISYEQSGDPELADMVLGILASVRGMAGPPATGVVVAFEICDN